MISEVARFEIKKLVRSPIRLWSLVFSVCLLIFIIVLSSYNYYLDDFPSHQEFSDSLFYSVARITTSYFFLPVWLMIVVGYEFRSGHVSQVVVLKGRLFYVGCKAFYVVLITSIFSLAGILACIIAFITSSIPIASFTYIFFFFLQLFSVNLTHSLVFLALTIAVQSPLKSFGYFFAIRMLEGMLTPFVNRFLGLDPFFFPIHFLRLLYSKNGASDISQYYNPLLQNIWVLLVVVSCSITLIVYSSKRFLTADLIGTSE